MGEVNHFQGQKFVTYDPYWNVAPFTGNITDYFPNIPQDAIGLAHNGKSTFLLLTRHNGLQVRLFIISMIFHSVWPYFTSSFRSTTWKSSRSSKNTPFQSMIMWLVLSNSIPSSNRLANRQSWWTKQTNEDFTLLFK